MLNYGMRSRLAIAFFLRLSHMDAGDEATLETYCPHMAYRTSTILDLFVSTFKMFITTQCYQRDYG